MFTATSTIIIVIILIIIHFCEIHNTVRSQDSSIGIATSYGLDNKGSVPSKEVISLFTESRSALGPILCPIQQAPGILSPRIKWLGCEADH
jgi:hypothetical protein